MEKVFGFIVIGLVLFFVYFMVMLGFGVHAIGSSPYYTGEAKYYNSSKLNYPIYDPAFLMTFNPNVIYFDDYSVSDDVITVSGYWRLKGVTWKKCDGSLSFKENGFSPRLIDVSKRTTVEIIGESCK